MKNYIIGTLIAIILVMASIIYKSQFSPSPRNQFPTTGDMRKNADAEVPLSLYVFFSKQNCTDCLDIIDVLNELPPHMTVLGLVPDHELKDETELREKTGAAFPLVSDFKYKKYIPWFSPAIVGVSPQGDVVFVLPGVPGEKEYLQKFIDSLYEKLYPLFLKAKIDQDS